MPPRGTRSKAKSSQSQSQQSESDVVEAPQLPPSESSPPHLLALPRKVSKHAQIVSFPHPVNGALTRFLYCPETGLYELSHIETPKAQPRSWLLTRRLHSDGTVESIDHDHDEETREVATHGYVVEDSGLLVATPYDPVFLLTPLFAHKSTSEVSPARPIEDLLDSLSKKSAHLSFLLRQPSFRNRIQERLETVSELLDEHGVEAYRPDSNKLLADILTKARVMTQPSVWPQSLEQEFVQNQLDTPTISFMSIRESDEANETEPAGQPNGPPSPPTEVVELLRLRTAADYINAKYIRPDLRRHLKALLPTLVDFSPLDHHLKQIKKLREEAQALRDMSNNISMKRSADDEDEAAEIRAEKRRKKEEEEKKKKQESRALKDLKKADTSGMKKLSSFFTKVVPQTAK